MALFFSPKCAELTAMHIWSENNVLEGTLNRVAKVLCYLLSKLRSLAVLRAAMGSTSSARLPEKLLTQDVRVAR